MLGFDGLRVWIAVDGNIFVVHVVLVHDIGRVSNYRTENAWQDLLKDLEICLGCDISAGRAGTACFVRYIRSVSPWEEP
jgi:hypothetical protein